MEGADVQKVVTMLVWHDMTETRSGDHNKIAARYLLGKKEAEEKIIHDQFD